MKKSFLVVLGIGVFFLLSTSAYGASGAYFSGSLGYTMLNDSGLSISGVDDMGISVDIESKGGLGLGVAIGYGFGNSMRIEGEFAYQKNDMDKLTLSYMGQSESAGLEGETTSSAFMVNGYYDFANTSSVTPYMSAGIGYAKVEAEITGLSGYEDMGEMDLAGSGDDKVLAYQIGAGAGFALSETLTLDAKYRYFATEDPDLDGAKIEYSNHNFYFGIRLAF